MSYLCTFTLYLLGCSHPCSSHIFWPLEHIFLYLLYLLSTWCCFLYLLHFCPRVVHGVLFLDTLQQCVCKAWSSPLSCLFMRHSPCLVCPQDTAQALVLPILFSCAFHTFSKIYLAKEKHKRKEGAKQEPVLCLVGR